MDMNPETNEALASTFIDSITIYNPSPTGVCTHSRIDVWWHFTVVLHGVVDMDGEFLPVETEWLYPHHLETLPTFYERGGWCFQNLFDVVMHAGMPHTYPIQIVGEVT